ncbi:unnamed protein product [Acanthoscelides obtectus]|uniref:Uncharacterized protein n=1 Tax=Acanthoscelides obtectus TaxID=200917 RepID=A0A9P0KVT1_ACAOB|nr:unnamed protein product [Acanthoscelides obtectus]CAK1651127.1 hypothetical protein AOBTE_LOCUS17077 [Acanthoscelides obtectus]
MPADTSRSCSGTTRWSTGPARLWRKREGDHLNRTWSNPKTQKMAARTIPWTPTPHRRQYSNVPYATSPPNIKPPWPSTRANSTSKPSSSGAANAHTSRISKHGTPNT